MLKKKTLNVCVSKVEMIKYAQFNVSMCMVWCIYVCLGYVCVQLGLWWIWNKSWSNDHRGRDLILCVYFFWSVARSFGARFFFVCWSAEKTRDLCMPNADITFGNFEYIMRSEIELKKLNIVVFRIWHPEFRNIVTGKIIII